MVSTQETTNIATPETAHASNRPPRVSRSRRFGKPVTTVKTVACLRIPHFPWQLEVARKPELGDQSLIVAGKALDLIEDQEIRETGSDALSARVVIAASPDLTDVSPGMPLAEATARHRGVQIVEADIPLYGMVFDDIVENLERLVPDIEVATPGLAYVGIWGLEGLYGDDANVVRLLASTVDSFDLRIGVGENKWLAYAASLLSRANSGRKVTGEPGKFLDKFPVDALPMPYELVKRLHSFGLKTMGHIADIPRGPMEAQFGLNGGTAWELANGIDHRPLIPKRSALGVSEHLDFPDPTVSMATILPAVESLLDRAYGRPQLSNRFARHANLQSQVFQKAPWTMRIGFKDPVGNKNKALFAIKSKLDLAEIPGPLEDMRITLSGITGEAGRQESMWLEVKRDDDLRETISQLRSRLKTAPPVYQVRELEPWSRIPERRFALVQMSGPGG